jgi:MFS transporter, FHS family, L-fucose permease
MTAATDIATADPAPTGRPPIIARHYWFSFLLVASLFFGWALAAQLNDVLIRQFQKALDLSRTEAGLIQTAFYGGYFLGAIPAGLFMRRFGYKAGILAGLGLYAAGALLFFPAAEMRVYMMFLIALYVIAFGLSFLETAANPYVSVMGASQTAPARLNLAQSFYGIGAFLGPFLGGALIFSGVDYSAEELRTMTPAAIDAWRATEAQAVQLPYLMLAGVVAAIAVMFAFARLPAIGEDAADAPKGRLRDALADRRLMRAVFTQFVYVGAQVAIWSFFIDLALEEMPTLTEHEAARLLSYGFLALVAGRFGGAMLMARVPAERVLLVCALANVVLCALAAAWGGSFAVGAIWLTTFFMSIQFPTIFALGVRDLGPLTKLGSSLMIMAIIGGALFPPLAGFIADASGAVRMSMLLPMACFVLVAVFAASTMRNDRSPAKISG